MLKTPFINIGAKRVLIGVVVLYQTVPVAGSLVSQETVAVVLALLTAVRLLITGAVVSGVVVAGGVITNPQAPILSP